MDQNNNQPPKHVQVENANKPEKRYIIVHNLNAKEGEVIYASAVGVSEAFLKTVELKAQGAKKVIVYQEVELKVTIR